MGKISNSTMRSALATVLGFVLVLWPENAIKYLVITIGVLFMLPGIFSILNYILQKKDNDEALSMFPIEAAGSILLGIWLVVKPAFFVNILMYLLGFLLVIAGVQQIFSLVRARRWTIVGWGFYIIPVLLLLTGILILTDPFGFAASTFIIFGVASIIYGFSELINSYRFRRKKDDMAL